LSRREFIATTAAAGAALALGKGTASAEGEGKSIVVRVRRPKAFAEGEIPQKTVADMVHAAVERLAGVEDRTEAWRKFVHPDDVVGLKINCLFGVGASTHPEVVAAIVAGCRLAGVPDEHILVWDRDSGDLTKSGYAVCRSGGYLCFGTDGDYEGEPVSAGAYKGHMTKILTQRITALINVPILKSHGICGLTMSMKNHLGSIDNPSDCHGNNCDPFLADINGLPVIRETTRLIIADALFPIAEGGPQARPGYTWPYGGILAATDTVAIDWLGLQILEARRREIGLGSITQAARHIATAAHRGLGTNDPKRIAIVEVT
jgi:uncharacterized protein (DUF362 family)